MPLYVIRLLCNAVDILLASYEFYSSSIFGVDDDREPFREDAHFKNLNMLYLPHYRSHLFYIIFDNYFHALSSKYFQKCHVLIKLVEVVRLTGHYAHRKFLADISKPYNTAFQRPHAARPAITITEQNPSMSLRELAFSNYHSRNFLWCADAPHVCNVSARHAYHRFRWILSGAISVNDTYWYRVWHDIGMRLQSLPCYRWSFMTYLQSI